MAYLHDPNRRAVPPATQSHGRQLPRPPTPYVRDEPEPPAPLAARADADARVAGCRSSVCSDCNLGFGRHVHLHVRSAAAEVARARALAGAALTSWGCPPGVVDDGRLLVSELLGNAVTHAPGTWITLDVMQIGDRLWVEVTDGSMTQPVVRQADPQEEQGRGMFLVEAIASAWGAHRERRGRKTTWCTLTVVGRGTTPPPR